MAWSWVRQTRGTLQMGASTLGWLREWAEPSNAMKHLGKRQEGWVFQEFDGALFCCWAGSDETGIPFPLHFLGARKPLGDSPANANASVLKSFLKEPSNQHRGRWG